MLFPFPKNLCFFLLYQLICVVPYFSVFLHWIHLLLPLIFAEVYLQLIHLNFIFFF